MLNAQTEQFTQALFGKVESVIIVLRRSDPGRWNTADLAQAES